MGETTQLISIIILVGIVGLLIGLQIGSTQFPIVEPGPCYCKPAPSVIVKEPYFDANMCIETLHGARALRVQLERLII